MDVATAARATANAERRLTEIKAPELISFELRDEQVAGYLIGIQETEIAQKDNQGKVTGKSKAIEYMVRVPKDELAEEKTVTFLGTWDLNKKFATYGPRKAMWHYIVITYLGEDSEVKTQGSRLKRFKLEIDERDTLKPKTDAGTEITDADIPF